MGFKVVSTGAKVGNINDPASVSISAKISRFRLNRNAAKEIGVTAGDSVTLLVDTEGKQLAIHKAIAKLDSKGNVVMKEKRLSKDQKEQLTEAGEAIPMEASYNNGCKLGEHSEFASSNTVVEMGLKGSVELPLVETIDAEEIGIEYDGKVSLYSYDVDEEAEEAEEVTED